MFCVICPPLALLLVTDHRRVNVGDWRSMVSTDSTGKSCFPPGSCCYHCPALSPPFASSLPCQRAASHCGPLSCRRPPSLPHAVQGELFFSLAATHPCFAPQRAFKRAPPSMPSTCSQCALNAPSQGTPTQLGLMAKTYTMYSPPSPLSLAVCSCVVLERDMTRLILRVVLGQHIVARHLPCVVIGRPSLGRR